jgi:hypothetical protein
MISNPLDAIANCTSRTKLAEVLNELMKPQYPNSDKVGWEFWAVKYSNFITAKKCALAMYKKMVGI